jgi:hypothetical protein
MCRAQVWTTLLRQQNSQIVIGPGVIRKTLEKFAVERFGLGQAAVSMSRNSLLQHRAVGTGLVQHGDIQAGQYAT